MRLLTAAGVVWQASAGLGDVLDGRLLDAYFLELNQGRVEDPRFDAVVLAFRADGAGRLGYHASKSSSFPTLCNIR